MFKLDWQFETFSPTGNSTAEGARNQLGRPELDPLTTLVREAAQNSWDARLNEKNVKFGIAGRTLTDEQKAYLRDRVFPEYPQNIPLKRVWSSAPSVVLEISDRGTSGLTGPTRADQITEIDQRNFVAFLRNIGQPRKATFGGGTYGYGKAVFYSTSSIRTICVHTRCKTKRSTETRFIAAALGPPNNKMTGRHWWGVRARDTIVDPLIGESAEIVAEQIGLPAFHRNETGTTILVLLPEFGEVQIAEEETRKRTPEEGMAFMAASMLWNFWPRLLPPEAGEPSIDFEVSWDGTKLQIPGPASHPAFYGFVRAMENANRTLKGSTPTQTDNERVVTIDCKKPIQDLGTLSLFRYPPLVNTGPVSFIESAIREAAPAYPNLHHVALMRNPRIVVKYESGPATDTSQYSGVFLVSHAQEIDKVFADSEPPTHDDWEPKGLDGWDKTFVRVALRRISQNINDFATADAPFAGISAKTPLGAFSEQLAGLIGSTEATSPTVQSSGDQKKGGSSNNNTRPRQASIDVIGSSELLRYEGKTACRVSFQVKHLPGTRVTRVTAEGRVAILDGSVFETDPPTNVELPQVLAWEIPLGTHYKGAKETVIPASAIQTCGVVVSIPTDSAIGIFLDVKSGEKE